VTAAIVSWDPIDLPIASGIGGQRHEIQFADINGDGRADYLWVHPSGAVTLYLNGGQLPGSATPANINWLNQGQIADGIGYPGSAIQFADLNGDGRAEYLAVGADGSVVGYENGGFTPNCVTGQGFVNWIPIPGNIADGVGGVRNQTVFADVNGLGRASYLKVTRSGSGAVSEWRNNGGDSTRFVIWDPVFGSITGGDGSSGANIVFADLNGDGRAEYLEVDPLTSAVTAYLNGCV